MTIFRYTTVLLFFIFLFAGCVSTEKRFERAIRYEEAGDYQRAAGYYIEVLSKDASWEGARDGLMRVGAISVDRLLASARQSEERGEYDAAIGVLDDLENLRANALNVGVDLTLPADYDDYRSRLSDSAVASLIRQGEIAEEQGDWNTALQTYARVQQRYRLPVDQNEEMNLSRARVHVKWAQQDLERGFHRSAFNRAGEAVTVLGEDHPRAGGAFDLQDRALDEGTRLVAFLPVWLTRDVAELTPRHLIDELNDTMDYEYWTRPPAFIAAADPIEMRREVRRLRYDRRPVTRFEAAAIGEVLDTDFVVVNQATAFRMEEIRPRERTRSAKTRGPDGVDTTWVEQSFTLRIEAEVAFDLIDTSSRRQIGSGSASANVSADMKRGVYEGDYRDLDLGRSERVLFDKEEFDLDVRELENELLEALAPRLAEQVFAEILKQIK